MGILKEIRIWKNERAWRKNNRHNDTHVCSVFPLDRVQVGKGTYGCLDMLWMAGNGTVKIGNYCSIGPETKFLVGGHIYISVYQHFLSKQRYIMRKQILQEIIA